MLAHVRIPPTLDIIQTYPGYHANLTLDIIQNLPWISYKTYPKYHTKHTLNIIQNLPWISYKTYPGYHTKLTLDIIQNLPWISYKTYPKCYTKSFLSVCVTNLCKPYITWCCINGGSAIYVYVLSAFQITCLSWFSFSQESICQTVSWKCKF